MNDVTPPNTVWTPDGETPVQTSGLPSEDTLIEAIATVFDPEIPVNIYELGLIYAVDRFAGGLYALAVCALASALISLFWIRVPRTATTAELVAAE